MSHSRQNTENNTKPYSQTLYQETYQSACNRLIDFFSINYMKEYLNYEQKTNFQKQIIEEVLRQIREFVKKKAMRQFETILKEDDLVDKFVLFDELYFKHAIARKINNDCIQDKEAKLFKNSQQFEDYDVEDEILDQLEAKLVKIYSQL